MTNTDLFNELIKRATDPVQGENPPGYPAVKNPTPEKAPERVRAPSDRLQEAWDRLDEIGGRE